MLKKKKGQKPPTKPVTQPVTQPGPQPEKKAKQPGCSTEKKEVEG